MATVQSTQETEITPEIMADAFWQMSSAEQADFFAALANLTKQDQYHAQMQWLWMSESIAARNKDTIECFLSFTAFAYDYWPQKTEDQFIALGVE